MTWLKLIFCCASFVLGCLLIGIGVDAGLNSVAKALKRT